MTHSLRRAALALHPLHKKDQAWLLSQMAPAHSGEIKSLLVELRQLGIPSDALPGIGTRDETKFSKPGAEPDERADLEDAELAAAVEWATKEADWVVAQVLLTMSVFKRNSLLMSLDIDRKQRLERLCMDLRPIGGLLKSRLVGNARAAIRTTKPVHGPVTSKIAKKGISAWLLSFAHRA